MERTGFSLKSSELLLDLSKETSYMVQNTVILSFVEKKTQFNKEFAMYTLFQKLLLLYKIMSTTRTSGKVVYKTNRIFK